MIDDCRLSTCLFYWQDADSPAACTVVFKSYTPGDLREERVVFAEPDVQARRESAATLPYENRSTRHDVAVMPLDAKALRIAVAAVA